MSYPNKVMSPEQIEKYRRFLTGKIGPHAAQMTDRKIQEHRDAMQILIDRACMIELGKRGERQRRTDADRVRAMKLRRSRPVRMGDIPLLRFR